MVRGDVPAVRADTVPSEDYGEIPARFDSVVLRWLHPAGLGAVRLKEPRITIGRAVDCDVHLNFGSVSRLHAEAYRDGPIFVLRDLGSTNGTYLNGKLADHAVLAPGDTVRVGECVGLVLEPTSSLDPQPWLELAPRLFGGPTLQKALDPARRAARSSLPIVLLGETGSGKERVARAIHEWSGRTGGFHAINCAALPSNLVESELFGYVRGAFTGAERASPGRLRGADQGTLLLDEAPDLSLAAQSKLLRVLEDGVVVPLGGDAGAPVDVRLIIATQTPLDALVQERVFRRDLRARLSGLTVVIPPLRERRDETISLFEHFLALHSGGRAPAFDGKLAEALCLHSWPDNVRELEMLSRRLLALHMREPLLKSSFLAGAFEPQWGSGPQPACKTSSRKDSKHFFGRRADRDLYHFVLALRESKGNISQAAARLGFSRQRAYRLMRGRTVSELMDREHAKQPEARGQDAVAE